MKTIPTLLQRQLIKMILISIGIGVLGLVWGFATKDRVTVLLTLVLLMAYGLKVWMLTGDILRKQYDVLEGTVMSVTDIPLYRQQNVTLMSEDQIVLRLSGRHHFVVGERYRLYLQKRSIDQIDDPIKIPLTLLAYEIIHDTM